MQKPFARGRHRSLAEFRDWALPPHGPSAHPARRSASTTSPARTMPEHFLSTSRMPKPRRSRFSRTSAHLPQSLDMSPSPDKVRSGIDMPINNAGVEGPRAPASKADVHAGRQVIETNLLGALLCAHEQLKLMIAQKSRVIIDMSSVHEAIAWRQYSACAASRAGLSMTAKTLGAGNGAF